MSARPLLSWALVFGALGLILVAAWRFTAGDPAPARAETETDAPSPAAEQDAQQEEEELGVDPLPPQTVLLYFPGAEWNGLVAERREIFGTPAPGDRAKQILTDLIAGPLGPRAARAVPPGTLLRQVFVLDSGIAYIDFSADLQQGIGGGSTEELLTVYAIVDSVALNVREIERVGILVDGRPVETLNGHVDLRRPLPPDRSYILDKKADGDAVVVRARAPRKDEIHRF